MARSQVSILEFFAADSPFATEFRRMLQRVRNLPDRQDLKILMITSATLSEGKSTVCSFLAATAARKGLKTLLVDCDLRRPTVHKLLALPRANGLAELLSEGVPVASVTKKTPLETLDVITAGRVNAHPEEVFDASAIGAILSDLKFYYDMILVDSPPVIPVSDPMLLAPEVDGVLLVIKAGATQREIARRAGDILSADCQNLLGIVLNNINQCLPNYYDSSHYGYDYSPRGNDWKSRENERKKLERGGERQAGNVPSKLPPSKRKSTPR